MEDHNLGGEVMSEEIQTTDQPVNAGRGGNGRSAKEEAKTFTQEEVNGLVAKEAKKAQEKIFKSLGFEDVKSAKEGFEQLERVERLTEDGSRETIRGNR